ncbi:hypothetical protein MNBD_GAMMA18-2066 [hydrothermal vent metagenome]|uniref:Uncharacterized protein n=1 Tax=hydrothermal vent metagenome TaxID=652676 RepID=A0A3B0ZVL8_9ZZZZ
MNKKTTFTRNTKKPFDDSDIDYSAIDKMTNEEVHKGALSDEDALPVTKDQENEFRRVKPKRNNND